jgi:hypothetical protein
MRALPLIGLMLVLVGAGAASAQAQDGGAATAGLCPSLSFTGFSVGAENAHVPERMWWDAEKQSYFIQGPELAMRFLYPDEKRPLAELKSDPAYIYRIPVDRKLMRVDQDVCRPKVEISSTCQMAAVPGALSQPALIFTATYFDECEQKPAQVAIRVEKLIGIGRTGIQFSFYNAFRHAYDSGMDIYEGENVFNMGYRLK